MYIDTHAHLYSARFDEDREAMLQRAMAAGVTRLLLPNIDDGSVTPMWALAAAHPEVCHMMMGLHPCSVDADPADALARVRTELDTGRYVAVGEIGIDLYWDRTHLEQQRHAFRQQVRWARELELPVAIHCRESFAEVITIVEEEKDDRLRGVFHCFTGSEEEGRRILALDGFYLGIGGVITYAKSGLARVMAALGPERCVLETDAPYLAPVPYRGKRNESAYIPHIAEALATATGLPLADIASITTANAGHLFNLPV